MFCFLSCPTRTYTPFITPQSRIFTIVSVHSMAVSDLLYYRADFSPDSTARNCLRCSIVFLRFGFCVDATCSINSIRKVHMCCRCSSISCICFFFWLGIYLFLFYSLMAQTLADRPIYHGEQQANQIKGSNQIRSDCTGKKLWNRNRMPSTLTDSAHMCPYRQLCVWERVPLPEWRCCLNVTLRGSSSLSSTLSHPQPQWQIN